MDAKELFWSIVNCPLSGSCDVACKQVLSEQDGLSCRQVPEPWSGNLETASFMGLGANPAIDLNEVFPSRTRDGKLWMNVLPNSKPWTEEDVYSFFTGRFGDAECPGEQKKYVAIDDGIRILKVDNRGRATYDKPKNEYWAAYVMYSVIINEKLTLGLASPILGRDIVVTDVVHCKGSNEEGVKQARSVCRKYTYNILKAFINNSASRHVLMIYGAEDSYLPILELLSEIWSVGSEEGVGEYDRKYAGVFTHKQIFRRKCLDRESHREIAVYYGIPKPSGQNRACQNIILHNVAVSDKTNVKHQEPKKESASGFELKELKPKCKAKSRQRYRDLLAE